MAEKKKVEDDEPSFPPYRVEMNIYQRIHAVRFHVEHVAKDKEVAGHGYKAVTHDAVTVACRAAMMMYGIVVVPSISQGTTIQDTGMQTSKQVPIIRYESEFIIRFVNSDSPDDFVEMTIPAHALDYGDKAPGKALSYAVKSAMLKLFSIPTGEDDEERIEAQNLQHKRAIECSRIARQYFQELAEIKSALEAGDLNHAAMLWFDIPNDDKAALWVAPTKGGLLTTDERNAMKGDEFGKALKACYGNDAAKDEDAVLEEPDD